MGTSPQSSPGGLGPRPRRCPGQLVGEASEARLSRYALSRYALWLTGELMIDDRVMVNDGESMMVDDRMVDREMVNL